MVNNKILPLVSIIIPVYNGENYLKEAIESALNQTYKKIEIVVVNDGSTDKTEQIAKSFGKKIRYFKKANGGVASALNLAIKNCRGNFISWLSHDDVYCSQKVELELKAIENSSCDLAICNVDIVDSNLNLIEHHYLKKEFVKNPLAYLAFDVLTGINGCALLIKKEIFDKIGLFNVNLKVTQDYDMWSRILKFYNITLVENSLVLSRQHDKQGSKTIKMVSNEVDNIHFSIINNLSKSEFINYFKSSEESIEKLYNLFLINMNCPLSAFLLLLKNYEIFNDKTLLLKYLLNSMNFNDKNNFKKKTILYFYDKWLMGGIEHILATQINRLCQNFNIILVTIDYNSLISFSVKDNVLLLDIKHSMSKYINKLILMFSLKYNVKIYIGSQNINSNAYEVYKILKEYDIRTVAYNHYNYFLPYEISWLHNIISIRQEYSKYIDASVWINKQSSEMYAINNQNSYYIPNASDIIISKIKFSFGKNILCVGRFDDYLKRLDLTLKVFSLILKDVPNAKLTIVGKVDFENRNPFINNLTIKDYIKTLNIPKKSLIFTGQVTNVVNYYLKSDLLILTSESEGFGMVVLEGANCGIPTISFDILGMKDLIDDNKNGFLIPYSDINLMAKKAIKFLSDSEEQLQIKKNAYKLNEKFNVNKMIIEWNILFDLLLSGKFKSNVKKISKAEICNSFEFIINKYYINNNNPNNYQINKINIFDKYKDKIQYYYHKNGLGKTLLWLLFYPVIKLCRKIK